MPYQVLQVFFAIPSIFYIYFVPHGTLYVRHVEIPVCMVILLLYLLLAELGELCWRYRGSAALQAI